MRNLVTASMELTLACFIIFVVCLEMIGLGDNYFKIITVMFLVGIVGYGSYKILRVIEVESHQ